jgi:hypothetical protein
VKSKGLLALFSFLSLALFFSCTKINEATELGDDLIPAVDNVNTFDTSIAVNAAYHPYFDSSRHLINENMALGRINDPEFGSANADMYFNLSSGPTGSDYGIYPFGLHKDSVLGIDSVVLSLSYQGAYGDTANSQIGVEVREIVDNSFKADSLYRYDVAGFSTAGTVLGSKNVALNRLKDSVQILRKGDTSKVANVLRIRLDNTLGERFRAFDTSNGFKNDSTFRTLFRGLAVKTTNIVSGQGAFGYFNLYDLNKSRLIVYYRVKRATGTDSAAAVVFTHTRYGQANAITRNPGGNYLANLNTQNPQNLYVQSSPSGSYIGIQIPDFEKFPNKVIHRAELIAYKVTSVADNIFTSPNRLLLERKSPTTDSAYIFENDLQLGFDGSLNLAAFGGNLRSDNSYRFNVTRYIQGLVTKKERNDSLRLYAPLRSTAFAKTLGQYISVPNLDNIAKGRVVIAGPGVPNPNMRLRLRIIYSNL